MLSKKMRNKIILTQIPLSKTEGHFFLKTRALLDIWLCVHFWVDGWGVVLGPGQTVASFLVFTYNM